MGASILVVDDSRLDRRLTEECLRRAGHLVTTASDPREALSRIELHPVDLVVTDLTMPGMDGLELLRRVKSGTRTIPVILTTGSSSESIVTAALRAGADDYVAKHDIPEQLTESVSRLLSLLHEARRRRQSEQWLVRQQISFQLANDRDQVGSVVRRLCECGLSLGALGPEDEIRVSVALEEALLNAIIHGNLEVSSALREEEGGAYEQLIAERRRDARYGSRRVRVDCDASRTEVRYQIADEGPGFDVARLPDPRDPERIHLASGRGVLMMRAFMDEVEYNTRGNVVTLVKRRAAPRSLNDLPAGTASAPLYSSASA
jgi:CheY-like chemotaxis protein